MSIKLDPKYAYIVSQLRKYEMAIRAIGNGSMEINEAAKMYDLDVKDIKAHIEIIGDKYDNICNNPRSLRALRESDDITNNMYKSLSSHYQTIDDFAKFTKEEFCKTMRGHHIAISSIVRLLDAMIKFDVYLANIDADDKQAEMTKFRDMINVLQ